jgi:hypothetical protein
MGDITKRGVNDTIITPSHEGSKEDAQRPECRRGLDRRVDSLAAGSRAALAVTAEGGLREGGTTEVAGDLTIHDCGHRISKRERSRVDTDTFQSCGVDVL